MNQEKFINRPLATFASLGKYYLPFLFLLMKFTNKLVGLASPLVSSITNTFRDSHEENGSKCFYKVYHHIKALFELKIFKFLS